MNSGNIQNNLSGTIELPFGFEPDERGMLHWVYHKKLWRTWYLPLKGLIPAWIIAALVAVIVLVTRGDASSALRRFIMAGFLLSAASFFIWAAWVVIKGGEECLKMAMGEDRAVSAQLPWAAKWARTMPDAAEPFGIMSNDMRIVISGLNRVAGKVKVSKYEDITSMKAVRKHDYVSLKTSAGENKIYARPEQLDFVIDFLDANCGKVKTK